MLGLILVNCRAVDRERAWSRVFSLNDCVEKSDGKTENEC